MARFCMQSKLFVRVKDYVFGPPRRRKYETDDEDGEIKTEILMAELLSAYRRIEEQQMEVRRSTVSIQSGGADYSWLISKDLGEVKIPEHINIEMRELCSRVEGEECTKIVNYFRTRAEKCQSGKEILRVFKTTVEEVIGGRALAQCPKDWVKNYISNSTPRNKISCTSHCTDVSTESTEECRPSTSNDISMRDLRDIA